MIDGGSQSEAAKTKARMERTAPQPAVGIMMHTLWRGEGADTAPSATLCNPYERTNVLPLRSDTLPAFFIQPLHCYLSTSNNSFLGLLSLYLSCRPHTIDRLADLARRSTGISSDHPHFDISSLYNHLIILYNQVYCNAKLVDSSSWSQAWAYLP